MSIITKLKKGTRKVNQSVHLWLGLMLGLYVVLIGLTGAILSFAEPIEEAIYPRLMRVTPQEKQVSLDVLVEAVRQVHPNEGVNSLNLPEKPDRAVQFDIEVDDDHQRHAFANPYTGEYLGSYIYEDSLIGIVYALHMRLLFKGDIPYVINGFLAILGTILFLTGLYLWWPAQWRQLKSRLTVQKDASYTRRIHDLHNVFGIYALPVLILLFVTGFMFPFYEPIEAFFNAVMRSPAEEQKKLTVAPALTQASLDTLVANARRAVPQCRPNYISLSDKPDKPIYMSAEMPDSWTLGNFISFRMDPHTGEVLKTEGTLNRSGTAIIRGLTILHFGRWGGIASHVLYAVIGFAPLGLFITGFLKWRKKVEAQAVNRARREKQTTSPVPVPVTASTINSSE